MRNKERKMIVLGAGASIGSKRFPIESSYSQITTRMPSAENFFYDLQKTNKTDNRSAGFLNTLGLMFEGLNNLITRAWNINEDGYNPTEWKGVNIEDVMTFFEVGEKMYPEGSDYQLAFKKAQQKLLSYMYPLIPLRYRGQHCEYLMQVFFSIDKYDSIISYNWDTIAENTLAAIKAEQLKNYAKLLRADKILTQQFRNKGLLLKLHGSFNWMVCKNPKCKDYKKIQPPFQTKRYKLLDMMKLWKCPCCGSDQSEPVIVPPVSNKMIYKNSFLKSQWLIAAEKLLDVDHLIFIGYSFPSTDYYSEWLFRQINFIEEKPDLRITVVNPEYGKKYSQVTKRFNTIFRGYKIESFKTLKDYAINVKYQ